MSRPQVVGALEGTILGEGVDRVIGRPAGKFWAGCVLAEAKLVSLRDFHGSFLFPGKKVERRFVEGGAVDIEEP